MILVTLQAAIDAAGTLQTFYYSTDRYVTSPSDTPPNVAFEAGLVDAGSLGVSAFSDGKTGGASSLQIGEIVVANDDGMLDALMTYSFDGRAVSIYSGDPSAAFPSGFSLVFTGTVESVEADWQKIIFRLKDKEWKLSLPVLTTLYAGTNSLPNGLEGTVSDLKGKVKPRVYGQVYNVPTAFVNTSKLTYQVSDIAVADIQAVYDRGVSVTKGADFANSTLLQAATPAAGTYVTCFAEGYFRLGTTPSGIITADVLQGANAAARTAAQIIKTLGLASGLSVGEISSADVTALDAANSNVIGVFIDSDAHYTAVMDDIANSVGAFHSFDGQGVLRMGQLTAPSGTPIVTLEEFDIMEGVSRKPPKDNGLPLWRVTVGHTKIYTVQNSDLAGAVTAVQRAILEQEYRTEASADASVKTQWLLADEFRRDTLLTSAANAATEAARLLAMYKVQRTVYEVGIDLSVFTSNSLKMLDVVALKINRFGMSSGKSFRIIGYNISLSDNRVILSMWG